MEDPAGTPNEVFFIYDGECPLCSSAALAFRIRSAVGTLRLINARAEQDHPIVRAISARRLNLDEGMVIQFQDRYYHGADALHVMALIGTEHGWFNRLTVFLFRSRTLSYFLYPAMRATRNLLIRIRGVSKINNLGIQ